MGFTFHSGELELQKRAGVREIADRVARGIHPVVPSAGAAFLKDRRFVVLSTTDAQGRPWASLLAGPTGFARVPDEHTIHIDAVPPDGDPLARNLITGSLAGVLAPDLATRRRIRINGRLEAVPGGIVIHVDQAYSNCPRYIQVREPEGEAKATRARLAGRSSSLQPRHRDWIRRVDTFFIATLVPGVGADASHRGGMPGFVKVEDNELIWADYPGNAMFNTLGNILEYPRAGVLIPDFTTGSSLQMTGPAIIEREPELRVRFTPEEVVELEDVFPEHLRLVEYSPFNPAAS